MVGVQFKIWEAAINEKFSDFEKWKKRVFKDNYDNGVAYLWNALCFNWKYWDLAEMEKRI